MVLLILTYYLGVCCCSFVEILSQLISGYRATELVKLEKYKQGHSEWVAQHDADIITSSMSSKFAQVPLHTNTTILYTTHSSIFHVIYKLTAGVLCPVSQDIKEGVKRQGHAISPRDPSPVTGFQLHFLWLVTLFWAQPFSQYSIHLPVMYLTCI